MSRSAASAASKRRLLLVDDDEEFVADMEALLGKEIEIVWASTLKDARQILRTGSFQLALVDLWLPQSPGKEPEPCGFELLKDIQENPSRLAPSTYIITASAEEEAARQADALGAAGFHRKPLPLSWLRQLLAP